MSGVGFLYSGGLWFLFIVEVSPFIVGGVGRLACQVCLFRGACISFLARGISSLWSAMECPVMSFEMGLCVGATLGSL